MAFFYYNVPKYIENSNFNGKDAADIGSNEMINLTAINKEQDNTVNKKL
jgi:hypothetical protein